MSTTDHHALSGPEDVYFQIFQHAPVGMVIFSRDGRIREVNHSFLRDMGYDREEILGLCVREIFETAQGHPFNPMDEALPVEERACFEMGMTTRDGRKIPCQVTLNHINFDGRGALLCTLTDITETKSIQDRLIRSERLAATGKLAASIAHEINSPLQGISSLLNVMKKYAPEDGDTLQNIHLLENAFHSIRDTVRHLLDLNRPGREVKQALNINRIIEDTLSLVRGYLKKAKVIIKLDLSSELPDVVVSPQQFGQVFLNLINNAVEAMTGISSHDNTMKQQTFFGGQIHIRTAVDGNGVCIEFADNGPGIPQEDLQYIFDPFYTRKKAMGMGVGLSICHGIVEDHNGIISAENGDNGGARFTIVLPVES